jgi:hypothetical protein
MTEESRHQSHERRLLENEKDIRELRDELSKSLKSIDKSLSELKTQLAVGQSKECPEPGACLTLRPQVDLLFVRVGELEKARWEMAGMLKGGRWTFGLLWALGGGGITAGAVYLLGL